MINISWKTQLRFRKSRMLATVESGELKAKVADILVSDLINSKPIPRMQQRSVLRYGHPWHRQSGWHYVPLVGQAPPVSAVHS